AACTPLPDGDRATRRAALPCCDPGDRGDGELREVKATVDDDPLPRDEARTVRHQIRHRIGDVVGSAPPRNWLPHQPVFLDLGGDDTVTLHRYPAGRDE